MENSHRAEGTHSTNLVPCIQRVAAKKKQIALAIVIIFGVGSLVVAGVGLAKMGTIQGWWSFDIWQNLHPKFCLSFLVVGTFSGVICITLGIWESCKVCDANTRKQKRKFLDELNDLSSESEEESNPVETIKEEFLVPKEAPRVIGKDLWERAFGKIDEIPPPIPEHLLERKEDLILNVPSPFWPKYSVAETEMLVWIPETINGYPMTLNGFSELVKKPVNGLTLKHGFEYTKTFAKNYGNIPAQESHWVRMTRFIVPSSLDNSFSEQEALLKTEGYVAPQMLEATICFAMEYILFDNRLLPYVSHFEDKMFYTTCSSIRGSNPLLVGVFEIEQLKISEAAEKDSHMFMWGIMGVKR